MDLSCIFWGDWETWDVEDPHFSWYKSSGDRFFVVATLGVVLLAVLEMSNRCNNYLGDKVNGILLVLFG